MDTPAIQDLITKSFTMAVSRSPGDVRRLFFKENGDWVSDRKRIQEMDVDRFAEGKAQGQPSVQRGISQGYAKEIVRQTVSVTRLVTGEDFKALTAHKLSSIATNTGKDIVDKIELDMRNFLALSIGATSYTDNGGFVIDTTTGDGRPVFDTAHTLKNYATGYSNILTGAPPLAEDAVEDAEDFFTYNVRDNNGIPCEMTPNTLITSKKARMLNRARRLFGSMSPESINGTTNDNAGVQNTYKDKYTHLAIDFDVDAFGVPDSTLSFYWFLACLGGTPETSFQAYYVSWLSPENAPVEVDQDAWTLAWTSRACYGIGAVSGKGIIVSPATF